jgi:hypothetical protein
MAKSTSGNGKAKREAGSKAAKAANDKPASTVSTEATSQAAEEAPIETGAAAPVPVMDTAATGKPATAGMEATSEFATADNASAASGGVATLTDVDAHEVSSRLEGIAADINELKDGLRVLAESARRLEPRFDELRNDFRFDVRALEDHMAEVGTRIAAVETHLTGMVINAPPEPEATLASTSFAATGTEGGVAIGLPQFEEPMPPPQILNEIHTPLPDLTPEGLHHGVAVDSPATDGPPAATTVMPPPTTVAHVEADEPPAMHTETEDQLHQTLGHAGTDEPAAMHIETGDELHQTPTGDVGTDESASIHVETHDQLHQTAGAYHATGGPVIDPSYLLGLVVAAEDDRPGHVEVFRPEIEAAVLGLDEWCLSNDIEDARRLVAAHSYIVSVWDELHDRKIAATSKSEGV